MVYNTQNYWVFGLRPLSGIFETRENTDSERYTFSEKLFSSFQNTERWTKFETPVILQLNKCRLFHKDKNVRNKIIHLCHTCETPVLFS
jgi:hypothetical protein